MSRFLCFSFSQPSPRRFVIILSYFLLLTQVHLLALPLSNRPAKEAEATTLNSEVSQAEQSEPPEIERRWEDVFGDQAMEPDRASPAIYTATPPVPTGFQAFPEQIFYRIAVDYVRNFVSFTDEPTRTFIVDNGPAFTVDPEGFISFPPLFEANDDKLYAHATFGTRGYGHERLNTEVSFLTYHDLDGTSAGSPFISPLDSFDGRSRTEAVNAFFEMDGLGDGRWSNVDLRVGRQYTHSSFNFLRPLGASVMDGVAFNYRDENFDLGGFVGYRPSFFSDPEARVVTGASFGAHVARRAYVQYNFFHYADTGIHTFSVEPLFEQPLRLQGHFTMIDDEPIDLGIRAAYAEGNWSVFATFQEQLTDNDFVFDIFLRTEAGDPSNRIRRINLGQIATSSRFSLDVTRQLGSLFAAGGRVWILELHDDEEQTGFDASFQDLSAHLTFFPAGNWDATFEYRHRNTDRLNPAEAIFFDDVSRAGETRYDEVSGVVGYRFRGRFNVQTGVYHRVFDLQNRITLIDDSDTTGFFTNFFLRLNQHWDFRFSYGVDNDFSVFKRTNGI